MDAKQQQTALGDIIPEKFGRFINRTGGTITNGDLLPLNLAFAATAGQAMVGLVKGVDSDDAAGYIFGAAINPTTEANARLMLVVDDPRISNGQQATIADNDEFRACLSGFTKINMTGANAGEFLHGTNASKAATPLTLTEVAAVAAAVKIVGIALEASSGAEVKRALFDGINGFNMVGV